MMEVFVFSSPSSDLTHSELLSPRLQESLFTDCRASLNFSKFYVRVSLLRYWKDAMNLVIVAKIAIFLFFVCILVLIPEAAGIMASIKPKDAVNC